MNTGLDLLGRTRSRGRGVQSPIHWAGSLDFAAESTADLDHTAASFVAAGLTWTQTGGTTYADDLDLVSGTGLVLNMSATSSTLDLNAGVGWFAGVPLSTWFGDYDQSDVIVVDAILSGIGDATAEYHGVGIGTTAATHHAGFGCLGYSAAGTLGRLGVRQQGATAAAQVSAQAGHDTIRLIKKGYSFSVRSGASDGAGGYPTSWTRGPGAEFSDSQAPTTSTLSFTHLYLVAQTGNTSNNFSPAFRCLRVGRLRLPSTILDV